VVIADIRSMMRNGYARCLESTGNVALIGDAADADGLLAAARQLQPDAILAGMTVLAPRWSSATRWTNGDFGAPLVAALPEIHDAYLAVAAWAGAGSYVLEDASPADLAEALRCVAARREGWSGEDQLRARRWQEEVGQPWRSLTQRERDVLRVLARGLSNAAIADATTLTPKTVEHHVSRILDKLGLASRTQAVVWYFEQFPPSMRGS
jgi:DNA-binding NarL/FixJ family response regulator